MNWIDEQGKEYHDLEHFGDNIHGFIYMVKHKETGKFYIGKKQLEFNRKKKLGKKELALREVKPGRVPKTKRVKSESDWKEYYGSCKPLLQEIKEQGKDKFERIILQLCYSGKQLTYFEVLYQMKYNVLQVDSYNETVHGRYYKKDFI